MQKGAESRIKIMSLDFLENLQEMISCPTSTSSSVSCEMKVLFPMPVFPTTIMTKSLGLGMNIPNSQLINRGLARRFIIDYVKRGDRQKFYCSSWSFLKDGKFKTISSINKLTLVCSGWLPYRNRKLHTVPVLLKISRRKSECR